MKSSYGHIRDLVKGDQAIDVENAFSQKYEVPSDKKAVVEELKKLAKKAEVIWLATDEDREGEAISWHLSEVLKLPEEKVKRIVFHEITKPAILAAIEQPRKIDYDLVRAQQARRVLDRLVGFELSPVLWKKVKPSLSAGRVQSVAVRLIVERERAINAFTPEAHFRVTAIFRVDGKAVLKAELPRRFSQVGEAEEFLSSCIPAAFSVNSLEVKPARRSPAAPFTTSTLQQEASRKLGFSVSRTMLVAQKLYESGKITYMRTDSVNLSDTALEGARAEISKAYGDKYYKRRQYRTKSASAQEAHEAIRPTYFGQSTVEGDAAEQRLYELIWKRSIASQMSEAEFEKTSVKIGISTREDELLAEGEVLKFDGFLKVYMESTDDEDENASEVKGMLPPLSRGQSLELELMQATERFSRSPARFTEASLVKKLEELGIGRPSTYAPTISTIQKRGYVIKEDREGKERSYRVLTVRKPENGDNPSGAIETQTATEITGAEKNKLFPSDVGAVVNDFLLEHFTSIMDYNFTASVEKEFDEIAQGMKEWTRMLEDFYGPFHKNVENTIENADKATGERELGTDPVSGKRVAVRIGRYGPFVQLGENTEEEKARYASLRGNQSIETIGLEEALELFKLPRKIGLFEEQEMQVNIGRFGPYVMHDKKFYSIPKGIEPLDVTREEAIEIIREKRKKDAEKTIKTFEEDPAVKILNGRWGPFIAFGKQNVKIPKGTEPASLSYEDCVKLAEEAKANPKSRSKRKK